MSKRGLFLAPFDELYEPRTLVELAQAAEAAGWDGFFLWDHVNYRDPVRAVADPWVAMSAIAMATERIRIGPMVTPISRRRPQKLARETVTLDHLSDGRLTLGVGLGSDNNGELEPFGEEFDPRTRAKLLDDGLEQLSGFWSGGFEPGPIQQPRIPVWVASRWPSRRPLKRAARWDGLFPIELPGPAEFAELAEETQSMRTTGGPFDLIAEIEDGSDPQPWFDAGATWVLSAFGRQPRLDEVREVIEAGPG